MCQKCYTYMIIFLLLCLLSHRICPHLSVLSLFPICFSFPIQPIRPLLYFHIQYIGCFIFHTEPDIILLIGKSPDSFCILYISGTRILRKKLLDCIPFFLFYLYQHLFRNTDRNPVAPNPARKAICCIRITVCVRQIRLNIINGRSVQHIHTGYMQNRPICFMILYRIQLQCGKPDRIRAERRTRCKYAHPLISAKARRLHHWRPTLRLYLAEAPYEPYMRIAVQPAQGVFVAVFAFEYYC